MTLLALLGFLPANADIVMIGEGTSSISFPLPGSETEWIEMGTFTTQVPCETPYELTATDITTTQATLSWSGEQESYRVQYRSYGDSQWQTIDNIAATTITFTGLSGGTTYEWMVRGLNCGDEGTEWSEMVEFTTNSVLDLADNDSEKPVGEKNADLISGDYGAAMDVVLAGRTLFRDSYWNTLCLPFGTKLTGDLDGATLMELDTEKYYDANGGASDVPAEGYHKTGLEGATLYLNFKDAAEIVAGTPYIIKWNTAVTPDIVNPVFSGVTIDNSADATSRMTVNFTGGQFLGTYEWQQFTTENKSILFLGANSTLFYLQPAHEDPDDENSDMVYPSIGAFRAYFQLNNGITAGDKNGVRAFVLIFSNGSEQTGISELPILNSQFSTLNSEWYTLSGMKVDKPTRKGVYIQNGHKVVVK